MYEFHYDYIKNKYDNKSKLLFTDTDSLMNEIKTEDVYEDLPAIKKCFIFVCFITVRSSKSKSYDDSNKLVIGKMKDEAGGVAIEEFIGWKSNIYLFLVDNSEQKKRKRQNENVVATISQKEYKDFLLNNKCMRTH